MQVQDIVCSSMKILEGGRNDHPSNFRIASNNTREGFSRKHLILKDVEGTGEQGKFRIRKKDVMAFFVTANPNVIASQVRQFYV